MIIPPKDWAEPKEEEEPAWNAEKAAAYATAESMKGSYGAAGPNSVRLEPLPRPAVDAPTSPVVIQCNFTDFLFKIIEICFEVQIYFNYIFLFYLYYLIIYFYLN